MAYRDFQHFLQALAEQKELATISEPVSPYLEITEIADRVMKANGPALLFNHLVGPDHRFGTPNPKSAVMNQASIHPNNAPTGSRKYDYPVAINSMGSRKRMSLALSCDDFEEHADRLRKLVQAPGNVPKSLVEKLKFAMEMGREIKSTPPKDAKFAPCQEIVMQGDEVDLTQFPILTCWPEDGGPYITLPLVFTHDPTTGKRNVGMYRMQVYDRNTCGMHWQMHKTGMRQMEDAGAAGKLRFEVAVVLGGDPSHTFSAIAPLPPGVDEMAFSGFLRKEPVQMVKAKTVDVQVPADAEIVIEGYVDPSERRLEGPFGDHTGYYSLAGDFPVLHVTAITMRPKPVWPATIVGIPPMEDGWMGKAVERIFLPLIQLTVPEIVDMNLPVDACFHNVAFVSIRKKYPGHAYKVMNAIWGLGGLAFTKMVFIFDEDTNVQDIGEVLFRLGANCDPGRDTLHSRGPVDQLDHASVAEGFGGKIGFDCTHKWPGENGFSRDYPKLIKMSDDVVKRIDSIWGRLGL
ncbi:MAG: menaquinone biosynthesis decarboxylase [Fimbriimonadaceae bacterium]|nr:menaquinone biosynthesis decarboxylase [Fimbriimonadaceae bacterium]